MIKKKEIQPWKKMEIDLTGPDGNVFILMGYATRLAKQLYERVPPELEEAQANAMVLKELGLDDGVKVPRNFGELINQQMMESDYENAIQVFDSYFGNIVDLLR